MQKLIIWRSSSFVVDTHTQLSCRAAPLLRCSVIAVLSPLLSAVAILVGNAKIDHMTEQLLRHRHTHIWRSSSFVIDTHTPLSCRAAPLLRCSVIVVLSPPTFRCSVDHMTEQLLRRRHTHTIELPIAVLSPLLSAVVIPFGNAKIDHMTEQLLRRRHTHTIELPSCSVAPLLRHCRVIPPTFRCGDTGRKCKNWSYDGAPPSSSTHTHHWAAELLRCSVAPSLSCYPPYFPLWWYRSEMRKLIIWRSSSFVVDTHTQLSCRAAELLRCSVAPSLPCYPPYFPLWWYRSEMRKLIIWRSSSFVVDTHTQLSCRAAELLRCSVAPSLPCYPPYFPLWWYRSEMRKLIIWRSSSFVVDTHTQLSCRAAPLLRCSVIAVLSPLLSAVVIPFGNAKIDHMTEQLLRHRHTHTIELPSCSVAPLLRHCRVIPPTFRCGDTVRKCENWSYDGAAPSSSTHTHNWAAELLRCSVAPSLSCYPPYFPLWWYRSEMRKLIIWRSSSFVVDTHTPLSCRAAPLLRCSVIVVLSPLLSAVVIPFGNAKIDHMTEQLLRRRHTHTIELPSCRAAPLLRCSVIAVLSPLLSAVVIPFGNAKIDHMTEQLLRRRHTHTIELPSCSVAPLWIQLYLNHLVKKSEKIFKLIEQVSQSWRNYRKTESDANHLINKKFNSSELISETS